MRRVIVIVQRLWLDRRGATAVEYGIIVALIVVFMVAGLQAFANANTGIWNTVSNKVAGAH